MGTLYEVVRADDVEAAELLQISLKSERNRLRRRAEIAERMVSEAKQDAERQRKAHEKEINDIVAFFGTFAGLAIMASCILAAPWWTAIAPAIGTAMIMRKAGWL